MAHSEDGRILMLVDDERSRTVCTDAFTRDGHSVFAVSRGDEALRFLERDHVEILVVELPGPVGDDRIAMLSTLRKRAMQPPLSVIGVTQSEMSQLRRRARDEGVIDFLSKPVEPIELACRVRLVLEHRRLGALTEWRKRLMLEHTHCCNIIHSIAEGLATFDADDRVNFINPRAAEMLGYSVDEVLGRQVTEFAADEHWRRSSREAIDRIRRGCVDRSEFLVRRKDGTELWISTTGTPLYEAGRYLGAVVNFTDLTSRHETEEALRKSEQRLSLAMVAADLGLWDWDVASDTAYLSPQYLQLLGARESHIRSAGAWFDSKLHPDDRKRVMQTVKKHLEGETPHSIVEYRARHRSGGFVWLRAAGRVVARDHTGSPLRMTGVIMDISDQKHTEDLLRAAIVTRDNVLAIAAHDLRNPLTAILLGVELLTERPRERERRKGRSQLETIRRSATHMRRLVENVLDAAMIEAGTFALNYASEDLEPLVDDLFEELAAVADRKSIHLDQDVPAKLPPIQCDGTRLREALSNLIGNALKFVPENGTVRLRSWARGAEVHFEVVDNGPGIPEQALSHLFDRYWTGDEGRRRGAGLGLFISKGIVDAHGGHMSVKSELGVGTTFHFTIPIKPPAEQHLHTVH